MLVNISASLILSQPMYTFFMSVPGSFITVAYLNEFKWVLVEQLQTDLNIPKDTKW